VTSITARRLPFGRPAAVALLVLAAALALLYYNDALQKGVTLKDLSVWLIALVTIAFAVRYTYQIRKGEISPTLSTWIIFLLGTGLSLTTYAIAERRDFASGILNTMDVVAVTVILIATIIWGQRAVRFKPFEKWYLVGIAAIVTYGLLSGDAWASNVFTQVLISVGYIPTIQNLLTEKRNVESFTGWGCAVVAGLIALYPAIVDGNSLAILYALRTVVFVSGIMSVMVYYELRSKERRSWA
jgi:CDP-diglyceride synthetase